MKTPTSSRLNYSQLIDKEAQAEDFHRIFGNEAVMKGTARGPSKIIEESQERMYRIIPRSNNNVQYFLLSLKDGTTTNHPIGVIGCRMNDTLIPFLSNSKTAEVDYFFLPAYWNQGYASEASQAFIQYLWESEREDTLVKVRFICDGDNFASMRVVDKLGNMERIEWKSKMPEEVKETLPKDGPDPVIFEGLRASS
ncbi:GNAT domain-containing protein [Flagelloscypha sp. PMI_526]|nr:GNAT domain-containing protein [Flagelloscypha sp. PMI_526]